MCKLCYTDSIEISNNRIISMKLLQVITAADGRINGADAFLWKCWGNNILCLEFVNTASRGYSHCYYNQKTFDVYQIYVEIPETDHCWIWNDPAHRDSYIKESQERGIDPSIAYDGVRHTELFSEDQILSLLEKVGQENLNHCFDQA